MDRTVPLATEGGIRQWTSSKKMLPFEHNKAVAKRFFEEALDKGNVGLVNDMFTQDCVFHRGDLTEPARGIPGIRSIVEKRVQLYRYFRTPIHQMIGKGDLIATRETHKGIHRASSPHPSARLM